MKYLFDFGISQEDPLTESQVLDIHPGDRVLSIASGGEIPLGLHALHPGAEVVAVDTSMNQIMLCKLKWRSATAIPFPENGGFLGYTPMKEELRNIMYREKVRPFLDGSDRIFWDNRIDIIKNGVVNAGRFETYVKKLRGIARLTLGQKHIEGLINCREPEEQVRYFDLHIATRRSLKWIFRLAFHPAVYRSRGLEPDALQHARTDTGSVFFGRFRDFCTATPARANYFLQYFLVGMCLTAEALPVYLKSLPEMGDTMIDYSKFFKNTSLEEELASHPPGTFNKIHLSNIVDWMEDQAISRLIGLFSAQCGPGSRICSRHLHRDPWKTNLVATQGWSMENLNLYKVDRFPFYHIVLIKNHG